MLFLGHIGITIGAVKAVDIWMPTDVPDDRSGKLFNRWPAPWRLVSLLSEWARPIDYRIVLIASLLPDILDKPLWFAFSDIFASGRGYGHSFVFNLALLISGLILVRYRKTGLLVASLSSFIHLILDQMWSNPVTLWWPLLGQLQAEEKTGWLANTVSKAFSDPGVYIPEIIGLIIILVIGYRLLRKERVIDFLRTGVIE